MAPGGNSRLVAAALSLAACAVLAPLGVAWIASAAAGPRLGLAALGLALAGPALVATAAAVRGVGALTAELARGGREAPQSVARILLSAAVTAGLVVTAQVGLRSPALLPLLETVVLQAFAAWLALLHALLVPRSRLRRLIAPVGDALFIGFLLHWGDGVAAPLVSLYLVLALDEGLRFGPDALTRTAFFNTLSFAAVIATTPRWQAMPVADAALMALFFVLPLQGGALARAAFEARRELAAQQEERARRALFLHHELRLPLDTIIAAGAGSGRDGGATLDQSARLLAAILDRHLAPSAGDGTEDFVLREVVMQVMAVLRATAAAKGVALEAAIDPRLPRRCRGPAVALAETVMNLLAAALAAARDGTVSLAASLGEREEGRIAVRFAVTHFGRREDGGTAFPRALATALARSIDAELTFDGGTAAFELALAPAADETPNLAGACVAVVTRDLAFTERLSALITRWGGAPRWSESGTVLAEPGLVVVLDARHKPLPALAEAHRLASTTPQTLLILVTDRQAGAAIAALAAGAALALVEDAADEAAFADALARAVAAGGAVRPKPVASSLLLAAAESDENAVLKRALERLGHRVVTVGDGPAALAAIHKGGLDAALIDLNLATLGGDAVAKLARRHPGGGLPLVALAPEFSAEAERRGRAAGFDAVAPRTGGAVAVLAAIERARGAHEAAEPAAPAAIAQIAAHPRYQGEGGEIVSLATIDALTGLGGPEFLADVVDSFRHESGRIFARMRQGAERGELGPFAEAAHALHGGAANVGGVRLAQMLGQLEGMGEAELKQAGAAFLERIESELLRLNQALDPYARKERHA